METKLDYAKERIVEVKVTPTEAACVKEEVNKEFADAAKQGVSDILPVTFRMIKE